MAVSAEYIDYITGQLSPCGQVTSRRMFGGAGLYLHGLFFAILAEDTLYFKVDDTNRDDYINADMEAFRPFGEEGNAMNYYEVPLSILEDPEQLSVWAMKAVDVARAKGLPCPTSPACSNASTAWSTPATVCWSSSTTWT